MALVFVEKVYLLLLILPTFQQPHFLFYVNTYKIAWQINKMQGFSQR